MKKLLLIIATLLASQISQANNEVPLAELKKILSEQEYMQYTHELWQKERKKAEVTNYSDQLNNRQGGNTLTVGPNVQCSFPTIQLAINFAIPGDTIFVGSGIVGGTDAKLNIDKELTLVGGLDSTCQVFTANRTFLQLDDIGPVITINVSGGKNVIISGFDISGSQPGNLLLTSGIFATGDGTVTVSNSHIHNNEALLGGGISAINGVTMNINENTEIYANTANGQGGGVYCSESNLNIINTLIGKTGTDQGNSTPSETGEGGGIYSGNCTVAIGETNMGDGAVEINYNKSRYGAGIFTIDSNLDFGHIGSRISFNSSISQVYGQGNAIYGQNVNNIVFENLKITDNWFGETIDISGTTDIIIRSTCGNSLCSEISRNRGPAIRALGNSSALISSTQISANLNSVISTNTLNVTGIKIINSIISDNSTDQSGIGIIGQTQGPNMEFDNVTIANNTGYNSIFGSLLDAGGDNDFDGGIIWGNDVTGLTDNNFNGSVMISNSIIQFPPVGYPNTLQSDPLFKNPTNGDYHIKFGSPAVDHFNSVLMVDFEGDSRPQGLLDDAGADEWTDLIFKNSFEQD